MAHPAATTVVAHPAVAHPAVAHPAEQEESAKERPPPLPARQSAATVRPIARVE